MIFPITEMLNIINPMCEIKRVKLYPQDIIVIESPTALPHEAFEHIKKSFEKLQFKNKVIILEDGLKMKIISPQKEETK